MKKLSRGAYEDTKGFLRMAETLLEILILSVLYYIVWRKMYHLPFFGFKGKLEPLIMVPMGIGMIAVNSGILYLDGGATGTLIVDPLVSDTDIRGAMRLDSTSV